MKAKSDDAIPATKKDNAETVESFLSQADEKEIIEAIRAAEKNTSGEIRVHVENKIKGDIYKHAEKIFFKLEMYKTKARNGVLFLVGVQSHNFAIFGDSGIHQKVGNDFWNSMKEEMQKLFKQKKFKDGIVRGIEQCGEKLREYFPYQRDDANELPDEISKG